MKAHTKPTTNRLEKIHEILKQECEERRTAYEELKAKPEPAHYSERNRRKEQIQHLEYLWEKACNARGALRELVSNGQIAI